MSDSPFLLCLRTILVKIELTYSYSMSLILKNKILSAELLSMRVEKLTGEMLSLTSSTSPPSSNTAASKEAGEKTEVQYGVEYIIDRTLQTLSQVKHRFDNCGDVRHHSIIVTTEPVKKAFIDVKNRGIRTRFITEITKDNLHYCKKLVQVVSEIRHLDGVKGNFAVGESFYAGYAIAQEARPLTHVIFSTAKEFVEQEQFFFDMLWNRAIPANQRFKEIEEGAKRAFVETVRDPSEIQKLGFDLIKAAEDEILILFSTANAFRRQEKAGALELLKEAARVHGIKVRILVPVGNIITERIQQLIGAGIDIRTIKQTFQNKLTTLVVDQSLCLTVELKDDEMETSEEAIGLATYSNSEATVFSYVSIFENLWIQTQLHQKRLQ
jgi:two-component system, OmpR family, sensor histidine kinase VicK